MFFRWRVEDERCCQCGAPPGPDGLCEGCLQHIRARYQAVLASVPGSCPPVDAPTRAGLLAAQPSSAV
jgi:hypothetical protein